MSAQFLIIDGYNLLHAAGLSLARYGPGDLNRQRHRLLVRLARLLSDAERLRSTVVFDAIDAPSGLGRQYRHAEITVLFAEPGHDADTLIESLIENHSAPTQLLVISSDHRLQKAAKHCRAESMGSDDFLASLDARAKAAARTTEQPQSTVTPDVAPSDAEDLAYWLTEFGEIDVEAIASSDEPPQQSDPWQQGLNDLQKKLENAADLDEWLNPPDRRRQQPD